MRCWVAVIALLVLSGCVREQQSHGDDTLFALDEVTRFGSQFAGGAGLTSVIALATTASEVFVLESRPARVAVFRRDGSWSRDLGRAGEGPGEFRRPAAIGLSDGLLWIGDPSGGRVEFFTLQGAHARSVRWNLPGDSLEGC